MAVDHARKHGRSAQIDDVNAGRNLDVGTDFSDAVPLDEHDLIGQNRPRIGIEQPAGA
ncbi:MAG: hypothetical protein ACRD2X_19485 [Vicinamibacteraceae bacterium]